MIFKTKNTFKYYRTNNILLLKDKKIFQYLDESYFQVLDIPKNLGEITFNDAVLTVLGVRNSFLGDALRFKDYLRYVFVLVNKSKPINDI